MADGGRGRGWGEIRDSHLALRTPLPWAMRAWSNLPLCLALALWRCLQSGCWLPSSWGYFSVGVALDDGSIPGNFSLRAVFSLGGFSLSTTEPLSPEWGSWPMGCLGS